MRRWRRSSPVRRRRRCDGRRPWSRTRPPASPHLGPRSGGSQGTLVAGVQRAAGVSPAEGGFGPRTEAGARVMQRGRGPVADGIVGPAPGWPSTLCGSGPLPHATATDPLLRSAAAGDDVRRLQDRRGPAALATDRPAETSGRPPRTPCAGSKVPPGRQPTASPGDRRGRRWASRGGGPFALRPGAGSQGDGLPTPSADLPAPSFWLLAASG